MTSRLSGDERGFALLVMFGLIGVASVAILLAVQSFLPPLADITARTDRSIAKVEIAARDQFRRVGAFPASMAGLVAVTDGMTTAPWRTDPWSAGLDLNYGLVGNALRARSRGTDGILNTVDDVQATIAPENMVRARQRARLRLIRAALARSPYRFAPSMSAGERASMVAALRSYATARRQWLTADAATRTALQSQMTSAASLVSSLASLHSCTPLPPFVVGAGGLMEGLGMPDSKAKDGLGAVLIADSTVAIVARGADAMGGTDDDM